VVALCDSALSPLADLAWSTFVVRAQGAARSTATSARSRWRTPSCRRGGRRLQRPATERLDGIEAAWREFGSLIGE
jgi:hypothetical protein